MGVEFTGAKRLQDISRQLQHLAADMQREVESTMAVEVEALQPKLRRSAITMLPTRGGLDREIAQSTMKVIRRNGAVVLQATHRFNIHNMNKGLVGKWRQRIPAGWFDHPVSQSESRLSRAINRAQQRAINKVR